MILGIWHEVQMGQVMGWWEFVQANWLALLLGVLGIVLVLYIALLWRYVKLGYNIMKDTLIPLSMVSTIPDDLEGTEMDFRAMDGTSLRGMLIAGKGPGSGRATVIFCHEFGSDKNSCVRYCQPLVEAGIDVFTFDFRNHGHSSKEPSYTPRQWVTDREVADMLGACAFVESLHPGPYPIGSLGVSRGGGAAVLAAAENNAVRAVLTDGLFSTDWSLQVSIERWADIFAKVRTFYQCWPQFWRFFRWLILCLAELKLKCRFPPVRKAVHRISPRPLFLIHGKKDSYIRPSEARRIFDLALEPKFLWIVPKAKHNRSVDVASELYAERTVAFFKHYLLQPEGTELSPILAQLARGNPGDED